VSRSRPLYGVFLCVVIIAGLATRRSPQLFPAFVAEYAGDTLWALTVFLLLGFLFPRASTARLAMAAVAIAFAVELSQLYEARWIETLRATTIGKLTLGSGFLWSDLVCYAAGICSGAALETVALRGKPSLNLEPAGRQTED
jgi:hypothetical protein